jgi:lipoate-protein ligase B
MHGFALNVHGDLAPFGQITPCGLAHVSMTSIERESGVVHLVKSVAAGAVQLAKMRLAQLPGSACAPPARTLATHA